jgi:hypothetical protein
MVCRGGAPRNTLLKQGVNEMAGEIHQETMSSAGENCFEQGFLHVVLSSFKKQRRAMTKPNDQ